MPVDYVVRSATVLDQQMQIACNHVCYTYVDVQKPLYLQDSGDASATSWPDPRIFMERFAVHL